MRHDLKVKGGAAAVLVLVFGAGAAIGLSIDRPGVSGSPEAVYAEGSLPAGGSTPSEWIVDRLDLSRAQRAAVDSVVKHYGRRMGALQKEYRPRYRALVDSTRQALRALLDERQRLQYDSLDAAVERRRLPEGLGGGAR